MKIRNITLIYGRIAEIFASSKNSGRGTRPDLRAGVKMAVSCMRSAFRHNYRNSSFIVDVAIGQIPRSTERISSSV